MDAKIADLGSLESDNQNCTRTDGISFTYSYAAPEFFLNKTMPNSDIYSYGCVLYYMLSQETPWTTHRFKL